MSEVKFTKKVWNEQDSGRLEDIVYEVAKLTQWGLPDESTFEMAVKSVREDGGSRCDSPITVNKFVALVQLIPVFCEEPKDRLIALARRETRRRKKARAKHKADMRKMREAVQQAERAVGYPTRNREIDPRAWSRWDSAFNAALIGQVRRPVLSSRRPAGHAQRTSRHAARTAASTSPGSSDDSDGGSDSSDSSDGPALLPLIGGSRNNNNPRKENNPKKQRKKTIVELSNRLELGSAALMFAAVASLIVGWSR